MLPDKCHDCDVTGYATVTDVRPNAPTVAPSEGDSPRYFKALLYAASLLSATGSVEARDLTNLDVSSSVHTIDLRESERLTPPTPHRTSEYLQIIRSALGTNISETARVLQVTRITIYAWLSNQSVPQPAKQERLDRVLTIANRWLQMSRESLRRHLRFGPGGEMSLLELLCSDELNISQIEKRFAEAVKTSSRSRSVRDAAMRLGLQLPSAEEQERALDRETGKRGSID